MEIPNRIRDQNSKQNQGSRFETILGIEITKSLYFNFTADIVIL
jgi:hypothetical protein